MDTGFSAAFAVSLDVIRRLGLVSDAQGYGRLADGSEVEFKVYRAEIEWNGAWKPVLVSAIGGEALIGMNLLDGHSLVIP